MKRHLIAADIGGSHISSAVVDVEAWTIPDQQIHTTKIDAFGTAPHIINGWVENLRGSAARLPQGVEFQLAVAMPGPFDYSRGLFLPHPEGKLGSLAGENMVDLLSPFFPKTPKIVFENDAACFGLGEACFGAGKTCSRVIGITLGTGVGSSFIADGNIVKSGMDIPDGGEIYAKPFGSGIADDCFSTRWFVAKAERDLGIKTAGVKELIAQAPGQYVATIFHEFAQNLFEFLLPFAKKFAADAIVIGGNIAKAWVHFSPQLSEHFAPHGVAVLPSSLGEAAVFFGAAKIFVQKSTAP